MTKQKKPKEEEEEPASPWDILQQIQLDEDSYIPPMMIDTIYWGEGYGGDDYDG